MPITYPLDLPTSFGASNFSIELKRAVAVTQSQFDYVQQVQEHPGEAWEISMTLDLLNREQSEEYEAFLLKLAGRVGTFRMAIPGKETPRGVATGTPLINGAGQTGRDIAVDGFTPSTTNILRAGDFVQIGDGLHRQLDDVDSNASGEVTLNLAPKVITATIDNDPIIIQDAKGIFRLKANPVPVSVTPPNQASFSFRAMEVR